MKWIKHDTNASRREKLALLRATCGLEGYGFYWTIMEVLAENCEEVDESGEVSVSLPTKIWCGIVAVTPQAFKKLLETCQALGLFSVSFSEVGGKKVVRISSGNLASMADEYTARKASRQRKGQEVSGQCLDTIGTMSVQNRIEESRREESREEDIKESCISDEIREDVPSSTYSNSEKEILLEATESNSAGFIDLETVSSSKRKIASNGNDRNRKSSDSTEKDANAEDENLEDCEKDNDTICASGMGADSDGGASGCDSADDNVYYFDGSRESVGSGGAEASACTCDGRNDALNDAITEAPGLDDDVGAGKRTTPNACPHKEIVALYHEILPGLRQVRSWNATRERRLRARWREDRRRQALSWWRGYFERVKSSSFLTGKKTDWAADFDWLIRPTNMAKVLEGKYDDSPPNESALQKQQTKTNVEALFRELVSSWPADRIGDMQAAKKTFCSFFADVDEVGVDEGNRRLKNLEAWALVVLEREPKYVPRLDRWLAGVDVSIPPPEEKTNQPEWVPVEDGELEAVAP
ncbi:MAG TPA: DUF4373 domain-containing protein [Thermosynergistes sp.]|nr:DUF4373 domain-containing protein [Thermosynergistes sp.]HQE21963.1 DUF4373 domain-containing protein [Thermosynergistes sp.]